MGNELSTEQTGGPRWPEKTPGPVTAKTIQNPTDWGYTVTKSPDEEKWVITHPEVVVPDPRKAPVVLVIVEVAPAQLKIPWAFTDHDRRPKEQKLALRDLILGVLSFHANRADIASLKSIKYTNVEEVDLFWKWAPQVYQLMSVTPQADTSLKVERFGARAGEKKAFDLLYTNAVFCIGARKMLNEYPAFTKGVRICESFEFEWHPTGFHFVVYF